MQSNSFLIRCTSCRTLNRISADKIMNRPVCGQCRTPLVFPTAPVDVTASSFDFELNDWPGTILIDFWAKWCGHCRMIEPALNDLATWRAGRLKVLKIDVDAEQDLARRFAVRATPTLILYHKGQQLARMDGAPKEKIELVQWVDKFLS